MSLITNILKNVFGTPSQTGEPVATSDTAQTEPRISTAEKIRVIETFSAQLASINKDIKRNSGYMARQEIEALKESLRPHPKRLEQYGFKIYSQNDEDGILEEIFRRLGISKGVFCEIGVENGLECNTLYLLHQGWRGAWLDADESRKLQIEAKFQSLLDRNLLSLATGYVTPENINDVLVETAHRHEIGVGDVDFLSIDIDGMDIYLFEALQHFPKVICIEYNGKFPPPLMKKPVFNPENVWRGTDYMGSSLTALCDTANSKGYSLVGTNLTGLNAFFVRNDLLGTHFEEKLGPDRLYNPARYYLTLDHFQYDPGHPADFGPYTDLE